ncbi:MAG: SMP-30/gluconolactonase/LRE family protein [Anaerolineales bacterium]|nr:SMP-30/gluconolactonase/LRE family protein [Anaerolineales bacterium]
MQPERIADGQFDIAENPLWHPAERRLYWTDIPRGKLYRLDPADGKWEECRRGEPVGGFTIQADGALLLFMARGAIARWNAGELTYLRRETAGEEDGRFNDVIADPRGRVFCGTMSTAAHGGRLYRLDPDGSLHGILEDLGTPNGMGFTPDRTGMYFTDSRARRIYLFDYDEGTGNLSRQRVWLETPENLGSPDGLTVDSQGFVWSARWNGSALFRYSPDAVEVARFDFPARKVSSVAFGGDSYETAFVTTALDGKAKAEEGQGAGAVFRIRPGVPGVPEFASRVNV